MSRPKAAEHCNIRPWLTAKADCKEKRFIQVGNTLLLSKQFQWLSPSSQSVFLCMAMESAGKSEFTFPKSAAKKYGIEPRTLIRAVYELELYKFIDENVCRANGQPNQYRFITDWKNLTEKPINQKKEAEKAKRKKQAKPAPAPHTP